MPTALRRGTLQLTALALAFGAALFLSAAPALADAGGHVKDRGIAKKIRRMSVGGEGLPGLFVANVYGESARTRAPADVEANNAMFGPGYRQRPGPGRVDQYKLRRGRLLPLVEQPQPPRADRAPLQRHPARRAAPAGARSDADRHRSGSTASYPACGSRPRSSRATWRWGRDGRPGGRAQRAGGVGGQGAGRHGRQPELAPDADVNINPLNPVIGIPARSARTRTWSRR